MLLILLIFVPLAMARLDLEPLFVSEPAVTFCIGYECPSIRIPEDSQREVISCNGTNEYFIPDEKDCHSYYKCKNGNATRSTCPPGYGFYKLGHWGYCTLEIYVKSCNVVDCSVNGIVPDPKDCTRFYMCLNGYAHRFRCPNGTFFDAEAGQCVALPQGAEHPCPNDLVPTTTTTTTVAPITSTSSETPITTEVSSTTLQEGGESKSPDTTSSSKTLASEETKYKKAHR